MVCAWSPWRTSMSSSTPSEACRLRETSYWKSTWPGVSIKLIKYRSDGNWSSFLLPSSSPPSSIPPRELAIAWFCNFYFSFILTYYLSCELFLVTTSEHVCALIVIPRYFSTCRRSVNVLVGAVADNSYALRRSASVSVVLPWSTCATTLTLRMWFVGNE